MSKCPSASGCLTLLLVGLAIGGALPGCGHPDDPGAGRVQGGTGDARLFDDSASAAARENWESPPLKIRVHGEIIHAREPTAVRVLSWSPADSEEPLVRDTSGGANEHVTELQIGVIEHYSNPVRVEVPETVQRNQDFTVRVITYGGGCKAMGSTDVKIEGRSARIAPYDWEVTRMAPGKACTDDLVRYAHTATLHFSDVGTAQVGIRGRRKPSGDLILATFPVRIR